MLWSVQKYVYSYDWCGGSSPLSRRFYSLLKGATWRRCGWLPLLFTEHLPVFILYVTPMSRSSQVKVPGIGIPMYRNYFTCLLLFMRMLSPAFCIWSFKTQNMWTSLRLAVLLSVLHASCASKSDEEREHYGNFYCCMCKQQSKSQMIELLGLFSQRQATLSGRNARTQP